MEHNQTELTLKIQDQFVKVRIQSKKENGDFSLPRFSPYNFENEVMTCSFQVNEDLYFFRARLTSSNIDYVLSMPEGIFQLQRRNNFRVVIPLGLHYECAVHSLNDKPVKIAAELRDFSLGGCQISLGEGSAELKTEDKFEISLKLHRFDFPRLVLVAKHVKVIEGKNNVLAGCSLEEPEAEVVAELQAMLMYLDRLHRGKEQ